MALQQKALGTLLHHLSEPLTRPIGHIASKNRMAEQKEHPALGLGSEVKTFQSVSVIVYESMDRLCKHRCPHTV